MNTRTRIAIVLGMVVLLGIVFVFHAQKREVGQIACTEEALICPDGTGVGRSGPQCAFSPCASKGPFTGELAKDSAGYRLIVASPESIPGGAAYAMPLVASDEQAQALLGSTVTVNGTFTTGSTLHVDSIQKADASQVGEQGNEVTLKVGQTGFARGVKITLHSVVQDNRCPVDVQCIEAGAITARVTLKSDTDSETFNMPSDEVPHPFDSYTVAIIQIKPDRISMRETGQSEYRVTFQVNTLK